MNSLTRWESRWNPLREMDELHHRLNSLFNRALTQREGDREEHMTVSEWAPLVDIIEDEKQYLIKVELPEIKKEDLKLSVENGVLTVSGERKFEKEEKGRRYHRIERAYGSFQRSFSLPDDADSGSVKAQFRDGVLCVQVAKQEKALPKAIDIKVG
ncbi:MAG TPA: Hsp20/alpha crystallin family protein [Candidatus Paceibacterota bacterium]|nr:Hsp20/alpha crystallin family protein [Verrucomicrobiota bacterium]HOX00851.1 Hsp20/alpha crystallin family protein [Verrucomicrobiota bacterium]HRZ43625.1 Hsp20/alpha crystallin family protein [Candidatus Paceibacterota bacterium]HRZ92772.1 Hsp20/alpha crystallin family protein [Candidatus Paceibacterota bacterium]